MIKVDGTSISFVRGDSATIMVGTDKYSFRDGDLVEMTCRRAAEDPEVSFHIETDEFINGKAYLKIKPEDTHYMTPGKYRYDIQLTTAAGDVITIVEDSVLQLRKDVTW